MRNATLPGSLFAAALCVAPAIAQNNDFLSPYGMPQSAGDDTIAAGLALGFNFTMPDGTVVNAIDVDSNGRILAPGADSSDYTDDLGEFLTEPHASICAQWSDITLTSAADDIYFNTDHVGSAWITWSDARQITSSSHLYTFQVQLHAATPTSPQRIVFAYDWRAPTNSCIVGVTPGNGAMDPGSSDLSTAPTVPIVTNGVSTIYEAFTRFDLQATALEFTEDGIGGWIVLGNSLVVPPSATNEVIGNCMRSLTFTPDGTGGYVVAESGGLLDPVFGADIGLHVDDQMSGPIDLGFVFPFPGGTTTQFVNVETNGRIVPDGLGATHDHTPTSAEFFSYAYPSIAFWTDLNLTPGGAIRVNTVPGVSATITWDSVLQDHGTVGNTFQFQLFTDGSIILTLAATSTINEATTIPGELIVGLSAGNGATDPGETDLSAILGAHATSGIPNVYELFDHTISEPYDLQHGSALVAETLPIPGAAWTLRAVNIPPSATIVKFLFGVVPLSFDLGLLGLGFTPGCQLLLDPLVVVDGAIAAGGGRSDPLSVNLPVSSMLGLEAYVQAVTDGGFAAGFPTEFSTGIKGSVGI